MDIIDGTEGSITYIIIISFFVFSVIPYIIIYVIWSVK